MEALIWDCKFFLGWTKGFWGVWVGGMDWGYGLGRWFGGYGLGGRIKDFHLCSFIYLGRGGSA